MGDGSQPNNNHGQGEDSNLARSDSQCYQLQLAVQSCHNCKIITPLHSGPHIKLLQTNDKQILYLQHEKSTFSGTN